MGDNKLIAEFMGWDTFMSIKEGEAQELREFNKDEMKFDTSWDWLMPVIQKIGEVNDLISENILSTDIDKTYKEVVRFIKTKEFNANNY